MRSFQIPALNQIERESEDGRESKGEREDGRENKGEIEGERELQPKDRLSGIDLYTTERVGRQGETGRERRIERYGETER